MDSLVIIEERIALRVEVLRSSLQRRSGLDGEEHEKRAELRRQASVPQEQ